jgi:hypothetical protein
VLYIELSSTSLSQLGRIYLEQGRTRMKPREEWIGNNEQG